MSDSEGGFQAVQRNVQQQGADYTPLGRTLEGVVMNAIFQDACLKPLFDKFLTRNLSQGLEQEGMVDVIKRYPMLIPPSTTRMAPAIASK
jgi:hypothetical protein